MPEACFGLGKCASALQGGFEVAAWAGSAKLRSCLNLCASLPGGMLATLLCSHFIDMLIGDCILQALKATFVKYGELPLELP